jgi:hypothetical protein
MQWGRRAAGARVFVSCLVLIGASALAGCNTTSQDVATLRNPRGATIAFESIDGPPPALFQKLVQDLNVEAQTRQLAVVSREGSAAYRVRGYLGVQSARGHSTVNWVWDVYDTDRQRVLRLNGEQKLAGKHRDAWAGLDDKAMQKIARDSMDQLGAFLTSAAATPSYAQPPAAYVDESSPEAAGIVRISQPVADPLHGATPDGEPDDDPVPLPQKRTQASAGVTTVASR